MPWNKVEPMDEKIRFIARLLEGERMTDLCKEFGISRVTGHKIWRRYENYGHGGLSDQPRRPHSHPNRTSEVIERLIIGLRQVHPTWGPKKLKARLEQVHKGVAFPAASTIGEILSKHALNRSRKRGRLEDRPEHVMLGLKDGLRPNEVWAVDFKGQFRLKNGKYCFPLTVSDDYSRFLVACEALDSTKVAPSIEAFEEIFDEFGLPDVVRSDNGVPFSARGFAGLTELSAWWLGLGILPQRIEPGHPEQNGRHERMHRTLKAEATRPAGANFLAQQEAFDRFREVFNMQRPHEALAMVTPSTMYSRSNRTLVDAAKPYPYDLHDEVRKVTSNGQIRHRLGDCFIGKALRGQRVGLRLIAKKVFAVSLNRFDLGFADFEAGRFSVTSPLEADTRDEV